MNRSKKIALVIGAAVFIAAAIIGPPDPLPSAAAPMPSPAAGKAPRPEPAAEPFARVSEPVPIPGWRARP